MTVRAYADNVIIRFEKDETKLERGIFIIRFEKDETKLEHGIFVVPQKSSVGSRIATVIASGPGYWTQPTKEAPRGVFIPNEVKAGEKVLVDALAGQDYALDLTVPRHNKGLEFEELVGERGQFRIVREQEILGVVED